MKADFACLTSSVRSAKKRMFLIHPCLRRRSVNAMMVRVFPLPVAMTRRACLRFCLPNASATAVIASFW